MAVRRRQHALSPPSRLGRKGPRGTLNTTVLKAVKTKLKTAASMETNAMHKAPFIMPFDMHL